MNDNLLKSIVFTIIALSIYGGLDHLAHKVSGGKGLKFIFQIVPLIIFVMSMLWLLGYMFGDTI